MTTLIIIAAIGGTVAVPFAIQVSQRQGARARIAQLQAAVTTMLDDTIAQNVRADLYIDNPRRTDDERIWAAARCYTVTHAALQTATLANDAIAKLKPIADRPLWRLI